MAIAYLKILITACSVIGSNLNSTDSVIKLVYSEEPTKEITVECQKLDNGSNQYLCWQFSMDEKTKKKVDEKTFFYKIAEVDKNTFLTNESKSQIYHLKESRVTFHERVLTTDKSQEKVCVGKVLEKR